jgi:hypothetical protein
MSQAPFLFPSAKAFIIGIHDPHEKPKRKSRARTKAGDPITLWRLLAMLHEFNETNNWHGRKHDGPGFSLYVRWGTLHNPNLRHVPLLYLVKLQFQTVVAAALEGRLFECVHLDPQPRCRCRACDKLLVKKPRGPRKKVEEKP